MLYTSVAKDARGIIDVLFCGECVQTYICTMQSIIGPPDGHRGPFNQVMVRHTHLYSLPRRAPPPPTPPHPTPPTIPSDPPRPLCSLTAMQLVLIGILCIFILSSPYTFYLRLSTLFGPWAFRYVSGKRYYPQHNLTTRDNSPLG